VQAGAVLYLITGWVCHARDLINACEEVISVQNQARTAKGGEEAAAPAD
jgi:hypothetical protein